MGLVTFLKCNFGFQFRDGRWEWAAAPGLMPIARYQHAAVFVGARLHITGRAVGGGMRSAQQKAAPCPRVMGFSPQSGVVLTRDVHKEGSRVLASEDRA